MTGSASDVGGGAVKGAALGAPLGPYGMAAGAVLGGAYGYLSGGPSQAEKDAAAAAAAHSKQGHESAVALENYRQSARDQYHKLLTAETTPYQGASNWLAAMTGTGMSTAGLAANENPLTMRDTGIGAPEGSNYTGWYSTGPVPGRLQGYASSNQTIHHQGLGAYLDHTDQPEGMGGPDPNVRETVQADPYHTQMIQDTSLNPRYNTDRFTPSGPAGGAGAGFTFRPRGAP